MSTAMLPIATSQAERLEWWTTRGGRAHRLKRISVRGESGSARDLAIKYQQAQPRKARWTWAVVRYAGGSAMASTLKRRGRGRLSRRHLTNSNSYSAPNFNFDTSTNVAGATALKGSAPAATDYIYAYNSAVFTVESNLAIYKISIGETSAGAATAGQRQATLTFNAGVTVTFTGDATASNSGVKMAPTSADAGSKACAFNVLGTAANRVTCTNSVGSVNNSYKFMFTLQYGTINIDYLTVNFANCASGQVFSLYLSTAYSSAAAHKLNHITLTGLGTTFQVFLGNAVCDIPTTINYLDVDIGTVTLDGYYYTGGASMLVEIHALKVSCGATTGAAFRPFRAGHPYASNTTIYSRGYRASVADIRQTEVVPTGLAIADRGNGKGGLATITNRGSYAATDRLCIMASDGTTVIGCGSFADYDALGGILCPNVTLGSARTGDKARATTDNYLFSAFSSAAAGWTPNNSYGLRPTIVFEGAAV